MALVDPQQRQVHCKIVYYGAGMSGKTTNLQYIHWQIAPEDRGELLAIATETERTLFFDARIPDFDSLRTFQVRFHFYTIPGCVLYDRTRHNVLKGADGVVFVADSQRHKLEENLKSLREMAVVLAHQGRKFSDFPVVLQYNKRDVPGAMSVERMDHYLNRVQWPRFEAIGVEGDGVMESLYAICGRVLEYHALDRDAMEQTSTLANEASLSEALSDFFTEQRISPDGQHTTRSRWINKMRSLFRR